MSALTIAIPRLLFGAAAVAAAGTIVAACTDDTNANPLVTDAGADASKDAAPDGNAADASDAAAPSLASIKHFVVIYMENHSFDNLYGGFPGAEGLAALDAGASNVAQIDDTGARYATRPPPPLSGAPDVRFPSTLPNAPFSIEQYVPLGMTPPDLVHKFYAEQLQINGGAMNRFAFVSDAKGLVMGHYDTMSLPVAQEAMKWTVCDHFHSSITSGSSPPGRPRSPARPTKSRRSSTAPAPSSARSSRSRRTSTS